MLMAQQMKRLMLLQTQEALSQRPKKLRQLKEGPLLKKTRQLKRAR
jgi:hypothetical protein